MQLLSKVRDSNSFLKKTIQDKEYAWDTERKKLKSKIEVLQNYIEQIEIHTEFAKTSRLENSRIIKDGVSVPFYNEMTRTFNNISTVRTAKS